MVVPFFFFGGEKVPRTAQDAECSRWPVERVLLGLVRTALPAAWLQGNKGWMGFTLACTMHLEPQK